MGVYRRQNFAESIVLNGVIGRTSRRLANDAGEGRSRAPPLDISNSCTLAAISASHILGPQRPRNGVSNMSREDRRDDTWLSDAQLAKCARADADPFPSPIPTQIVSNGEWMPMPQTREQQRVEARTKEHADRAAKKPGMSRRKFLAD